MPRAAHPLRRPIPLGSRLALGLLLAAAAVFGARAEDDPERRTRGDEVAILRDVRVADDEIVRGDVVCIFGDVVIEGEVTGEVVVVGGNLRVAGPVRDDAVAVLSSVTVAPEGSFGGDLVSILGSLSGPRNIRGQLVNIPLPLLPSGWSAPFGMIGALVAWGALLWTAFTFLLLLLLSALAPDRVRVVSEEAPVNLLWAYLVGIGGYAGMFLVVGLLTSTLIGIPLAMVTYLAFILLKWIGLAGIYHRVGTRLARGFGHEPSLLGAILLGFLPFALLQLSPLFLGAFGIVVGAGIRLLFWLLVEIPAVGLVVLTRLGGRSHAPASPPAAAPV